MDAFDVAPAVTDLRNGVAALARLLKASARDECETWATLMLLGAIERAGGTATPGELALQLDLRSSNLAQMLGELEQRGLLERRADLADRRKVRVLLTAAGRRMVKQTRARRDAWLQAAINGGLDPAERSQLLAAAPLLLKLAASAQPRAV